MGALIGHDTRLIQQLAAKCADVQATLKTQVLFKGFVRESRWWEQEADADYVSLLQALDSRKGTLKD
jgi:hypothetical protein